MSTGVTDAGLANLEQMKSLEQLSLYRTRVTNAGLEALKELKSLREVDVRYSRATQAGVNTLQKSLPDTRFVFVGTAPRVSPPPAKAGASFSAWVRSQGGKVVVERGRVVEVSLAASSVSDADMAKLARLSGLRKLDLKGTEVGDLGLKHLARLINLVDLDLGETAVSDAGLASLSRMKSLKRLSLKNTYVEGTGLASLTSLEDLDLLGAPITDTGAGGTGAIHFACPAIARRDGYHRCGLGSSDKASQVTTARSERIRCRRRGAGEVEGRGCIE